MGVSICPSRYPSRTVRRTDFNFCMVVKWKDIYVKSVGQGHRSKVKVTRSKNVHNDVPLTSKSLVYIWTKKKLRNRTGRNTAWGVSKAYVFLCII